MEELEMATEVVDVMKGTGSNGFKTVAKVGLLMGAGALLWDYGVKPLGRLVANQFGKYKAKHQTKAPIKATSSSKEAK